MENLSHQDYSHHSEEDHDNCEGFQRTSTPFEHESEPTPQASSNPYSLDANNYHHIQPYPLPIPAAYNHHMNTYGPHVLGFQNVHQGNPLLHHLIPYVRYSHGYVPPYFYPPEGCDPIYLSPRVVVNRLSHQSFQGPPCDNMDERGTKRPNQTEGSRCGSKKLKIQPDQASLDIKFFYTQNLLTDGMRKKKNDLQDLLETIIAFIFPNGQIFVVGSSRSGFGSKYSDLDLCLMLSKDEIDQQEEAMKILDTISQALESCSFLTDVYVIRAIVPILRFKEKRYGIECDLNINNSVGIRNTYLLYAYSRLDWRVPPVVLMIKHWAKKNNINDAAMGTISSYSLVLMVLHYLQYGCKPPVIPCLQRLYPNEFHPERDLTQLQINKPLPIHYTSNNRMTLYQLVMGFFGYFANVFDFGRHAMSIRTGGVIPKLDGIRRASDPTSWKFLCIEEPYTLINTARSVHNREQFRRIQDVFMHSSREISHDYRGILHLGPSEPCRNRSAHFPRNA